MHEISIVKRSLFIRHEALAVEIRPAPPNSEPAEPAFFILIDRATFCSSIPSGGSSNDRIICSQQRPSPLWSARIWGLGPAVGHQNLGMNIVQLAIALRSAVEYAPHYNALKQNCLWLTYTSTTLIQQHILPRNTFIIDNNEKCLFRRGKLFFLPLGSPTLEDITTILQRYNDRFQMVCYCLKSIQVLIICLASTTPDPLTSLQQLATRPPPNLGCNYITTHVQCSLLLITMHYL